jgi:hypothetical protein
MICQWVLGTRVKDEFTTYNEWVKFVVVFKVELLPAGDSKGDRGKSKGRSACFKAV